MSTNHKEPAATTRTISKRACDLLTPPVAYFEAVFKAFANPWTLENTDGWIPLAVAQNTLLLDDFLTKLKDIEKTTDYPEYTMMYARAQGIDPLVNALANLMTATFLDGLEIDPQCICVSSGISGVLDNIFFLLGDEGQGVLIPAPYYPVFDNDLEARNHLVPLPLHLKVDDEEDIHSQLDAASATAAANGNPVTALLITNPLNPTGTIYSEAAVRAMLTWCLKNKIHYVSDEVYALSIYRQETPFVSALNVATKLVEGGVVDQEVLDEYLHMLYGVSKDWGAAGLSLGLVYSKNKDMNTAMGRLVYFNNVSNTVQFTLAKLFEDLDWCKAYIDKNATALRHSYDLLSSALTKAGIPYTPAEAGMFVWLDLSRWLGEEEANQTWEAEWALFEKLAYEGHVVLTPGQECHAEKPGGFRVCFAGLPPEALSVGVERMKRILDSCL